jgi:hypothetical protein
MDEETLAYRTWLKAEQDRDEYKRQRDDISEEMERCHRMLDAHYGEDLETTSLVPLEDRLAQLLTEIKPQVKGEEENGYPSFTDDGMPLG